MSTPTLRPGTFVYLDCDTYRPRRVHEVVRLDGDGAWLRDVTGDDPATFCLNPTAGHERTDQTQGVLW